MPLFCDRDSDRAHWQNDDVMKQGYCSVHAFSDGVMSVLEHGNSVRRIIRWIILFIAGVLLLFAGAVMAIVLWSTHVERESLARIKLGMSKPELRSAVGMPTTADFHRAEGFPWDGFVTRTVHIGRTDGYRTVDTYDFGLGSYWVYFDADGRVIAVCEEIDWTDRDPKQKKR